ncbi:MAG: ribonuclease P protein subunit [Sulfolobales archaeon]
MRRRASNIVYHELLGLYVKIISSTDPSVEGLEGVVVGETMKTLRILAASDNKTRTVFKVGNVFKFRIPESGEEVVVMGDQILGRPGERARRLVKR